MATDTFAKIGDIKGESQDDKHKEEIELLVLVLGREPDRDRIARQRRRRGEGELLDFSFAHYVDKASPNLMKGVRDRRAHQGSDDHAAQAGKGQQEYLIIKMNAS